MAVVATGFFDGVHLGHRKVIETLLKAARERGEQSLIVTFWPHPRTVLQKDARTLRLLTSLEEKKSLLYSCGVDRVEVIDFSREFSSLTTERYLEEYVKNRFGGTALLLGYDNRMGHDPGTPESIAAQAQKVGLDVIMAPKIELSGGTISSTKIRQAIAEGFVDNAARMLGYCYGLHGVVVAGNQLGRTLGFPTANMQMYEPLKLIPQNGVYLTAVETLGRKFYGMTNIGVRPTVGVSQARTIETHIFDFDEDIYGLDMKVTFLCRIRAEKKFSCLDELKKQLGEDELVCKRLIFAAV